MILFVTKNSQFLGVNIEDPSSTTVGLMAITSTTDPIIYDSCETIHGEDAEICKKFYEEHPELKKQIK
jgi:hypothetical protein